VSGATGAGAQFCLDGKISERRGGYARIFLEENSVVTKSPWKLNPNIHVCYIRLVIPNSAHCDNFLFTLPVLITKIDAANMNIWVSIILRGFSQEREFPKLKHRAIPLLEANNSAIYPLKREVG